MLYAGSSKITPLIYSEGGTATLTVVNHSSFDRSTNEKIFLNQITGGWEIIDYASADINSITAKCDENIAKNATGTVSLSVNGQLMNHEVRDFSLGSGVNDSDINDNTKQFTSNRYSSSSNNNLNTFIVSPDLNLPKSQNADMLLKVKFKVLNNDTSVENKITGWIISCGYNNTITFPSGSTDLPHIYCSSDTEKITSEFKYVYTENLSVSYGTLVQFDKWIEATLRCKSSLSPKSLFTVKDQLGDIQQATDAYVPSTSDYAIRRVYVGARYSTTNNIAFVYDLDNTGLYTGDGETLLWKPYKEIIA